MKEQKIGTVTFSHGDQPVKIENPGPLESTYSSGETRDVPLGEFLARPVKIFEVNPALGTTTHVQFYPWKSFLEDPAVKRRIEGFRHVRGKLHIRAVCTGNPFMYGKYGLSYRPFFDRSVHQLCGGFSDARLIQATSCPHIFIDPTTSEGGEMVLPFFTPFNWIDLSETRMRKDMGALDFFTLVPLRHANSASATFNVQVYAWMEDAEICTPTTQAYDAWTLQSLSAETSTAVSAASNFLSMLLALFTAFLMGKRPVQNAIHDSVRTALSEKNGRSSPCFEEEEQQNEFSEHPISTTASAVAKASGVLESIPGLAPYAKATEMGAKATAAVARAFGFSRPANIESICRYKPFIGEFSTTNTHEPIARLGLDVKGELTVDPRTVGLDGTDEMAFKHILAKEVVFQKFDWAEGTAPGTSLGELNVSPLNGDTDTTTSPVRFVMTPQAGIASLFRYWSGTMIYRFQIVASALHRGKIRIIYDPVKVGATSPTNEVYSRVIDISETRDFELPINWHSASPYLELEELAIPTSGQWNSATTLATFSPKYNNGQVRIEVFTPLQSPDPSAGNDVTIMVSTRCGEDFKFAKPSAFSEKAWTFTSSDALEEPQSTFADDVVTQDNEPVEGTPLENIGAGEAPVTDHLPMVFFGETIESIRTYLRRYTFLRAVASSTSQRIHAEMRSNTTLSPPEFLSNCYVGWRGSIRLKSFFKGTGEAMIASIGDGLLGGDFANNLCADAGMAMFTDVAEFELPFFSMMRFGMAQSNPTWLSGTLQSFGTADPNELRFQTFLSGSPTSVVRTYKACGEDYSLFFYTGVPPIYDVV